MREVDLDDRPLMFESAVLGLPGRGMKGVAASLSLGAHGLIQPCAGLYREAPVPGR